MIPRLFLDVVSQLVAISEDRAVSVGHHIVGRWQNLSLASIAVDWPSTRSDRLIPKLSRRPSRLRRDANRRLIRMGITAGTPDRFWKISSTLSAAAACVTTTTRAQPIAAAETSGWRTPVDS
jgi:hypothetical protein